MARTQSSMLALGTKAPDFQLTDVVRGKRFSPQQARVPTACW